MREALSQPEQEPCEYCKRGLKTMCLCGMKAQPEQELTTTLEASVHAGLDKKNDKNPQVDHQGKQPEQEPVAWRHDMGAENNGWEYFEEASCPDCQPLYTTPPQRKPLTDELYNELLFAVGNKYPNETRHQTALRYILQAEKGDEKAVYGIKE